MTQSEAQNNIGKQFKWIHANGGILGRFDTIINVKQDGTIQGNFITAHCSDCRLKGDEPAQLKHANMHRKENNRLN